MQSKNTACNENTPDQLQNIPRPQAEQVCHITLLVKLTNGTAWHTTCTVENELVQKVPLG